MSLPAFGSLSLLDERELAEEDLKGFEGADLITSGHWFTPKGKAFRKEYQGLYGELPGAVAAYAHDGTGIIIEALRKAGNLERESIQKALAHLRYEGLTGVIQFDDKGNRSGPCQMMGIRNGLPVAVETTLQ
jgi:ABC-type branched-subunit amino acid transport system substrate-binding protein